MGEVTLMEGSTYRVTWKDSFKWASLITFLLLGSWLYAFIVTHITLGPIYNHYNIPIDLLNAGAIGYALFNVTIIIKNWEMTREVFISETRMSLKKIIISILVVSSIVAFYSLIGWVIGGYAGTEAAFWIPIFIALWDGAMLNPKTWYLTVFGWAIFIAVAIIKLLKLGSLTEYNAVAYGVSPIASLILFLLRNHAR